MGWTIPKSLENQESKWSLSASTICILNSSYRDREQNIKIMDYIHLMLQGSLPILQVFFPLFSYEANRKSIFFFLLFAFFSAMLHLRFRAQDLDRTHNWTLWPYLVGTLASKPSLKFLIFILFTSPLAHGPKSSSLLGFDLTSASAAPITPYSVTFILLLTANGPYLLIIQGNLLVILWADVILYSCVGM